ncbi:MAG: DUF4432 family protein [Chloroflexi bacterium]|jgi:hypothetical protein|nr:DUF4432 family protein [Chloroflexota bacterium]
MHYQDERTTGCRISDSWTYRGLKTVVLENELLRVSIIADKGADVFELTHKKTDTEFMWRTPWSVRNQSLSTPPTGNGDNIWHDAYIGGWQTIAPTGGPPQTYANADLGQHTEATLMPWDAVIVEDSPEKVSAKFTVRTVRTPFWIEKVVSLESGSPVLTVTDTLTNQAEEDAEAQWGQHVALGDPFVTPNCRLDMAPADHFVPERGGDRLLDGHVGKWPTALDPDGNEVDLTSFPPKSDRVQDYSVFKNQKEGWYAVTNPDRGVGFGLAYPVDTFKYLWYWQVFGGASGYPWYGRTYNVGLEPFTSLSAGIPEPSSDQRTSIIFKPGETRSATVRAVVYESTTGVSRISPEGDVTVN